MPTLFLVKIVPRDNLLPCRQGKATGIVVAAVTFISTKQIKERNCDLVLINTRLLERADWEHWSTFWPPIIWIILKYIIVENVQTATVLSAVSLLTFNLGLNSFQQRL